MNTTHRILVIANETLDDDALHELICNDTGGKAAEVLVVAPALNSRLRYWLSDEDDARTAAEERLARSLERLEAQGVHAFGWVGDADPLRSIEDALAVFAADQLLISTHDAGRSNWLARDVVRRAAEVFGLPTTHVLVHAVRSAA